MKLTAMFRMNPPNSPGGPRNISGVHLRIVSQVVCSPVPISCACAESSITQTTSAAIMAAPKRGSASAD